VSGNVRRENRDPGLQLMAALSLWVCFLPGVGLRRCFTCACLVVIEAHGDCYLVGGDICAGVELQSQDTSPVYVVNSYASQSPNLAVS
jgi:hypothetical protein